MFERELFICIKMDLALNSLQWLICHKNKPNQIFCVCLLSLLVTDWLYLSISKRERSLFRTSDNPQAGHKCIGRQHISRIPKSYYNNIFKSFIYFYLTSTFYTSRGELVITVQIFLGSYTDTHIHRHTHTHTHGQFPTLHIYSPARTYIHVIT